MDEQILIPLVSWNKTYPVNAISHVYSYESSIGDVLCDKAVSH